MHQLEIKPIVHCVIKFFILLFFIIDLYMVVINLLFLKSVN